MRCPIQANQALAPTSGLICNVGQNRRTRLYLSFALVAASLLSGCALLPPSRSSLEGTHTASISFNLGTAVTLNHDGTYRRDVSLFYCSPLVIKSGDGREEETLDGWTNTETGKWT